MYTVVGKSTLCHDLQELVARFPAAGHALESETPDVGSRRNPARAVWGLTIGLSYRPGTAPPVRYSHEQPRTDKFKLMCRERLMRIRSGQSWLRSCEDIASASASASASPTLKHSQITISCSPQNQNQVPTYDAYA
jgi:hypothetical protein